MAGATPICGSSSCRRRSIPRPVAAFLGGCPIIDVPGTLHPMTVEYAPGESVAEALGQLAAATRGNVLCFLPGAREIAATIGACERVARSQRCRARRRCTDRSTPPSRMRRCRRTDCAPAKASCATNVAETSLTVPGVSVVDRHRPSESRALRRRSRHRFADDRAHHARQRRSARRPRRPARSRHRAAAVGCARSPAAASRSGDPSRRSVGDAAVDPGLGSVSRTPSNGSIRRIPIASSQRWRCWRGSARLQDGQITALGRQMQRLPLHPRLARVLIAARGSFEGSAACAWLSEPAPFDGFADRPCDLVRSVAGHRSVEPNAATLAAGRSRICSSIARAAARRRVSRSDR